MTHSATGEREVRLTLTDGEYEDLRAAMDLDAHAVPSGDPALVYARAIKHYREYLQKRRLGAKPGSEKSAHPCRGRGIPKALVQLVWERDGGQCKFIGKGGHRCEEKSGLQIDHITPFAKGGQATSDNLRLLCRAHNRFEAERVFGKEHVQRQRELAQRVRARDKVAAEVEAERAEARKGLAAEAGAASEHAPDGLAPEAGIQRAAGRSPAQQSRHDDIHSALRGLGFSAAEARRGAELADTMPDASLEACVKAALTALTRQVALRGERRARCTA
jgi:5-methylcytosine-specific restriction endonuclease McrA